MVWELVLTVMLNGEPREIDWLTLQQQQTCTGQADWLNSHEDFTSYHGARSFCRELARERAHYQNFSHPAGPNTAK